MIQAREIEVKYRVPDAAIMELALATRSLVLATPVHQDDQAYTPNGWSYGISKQGVPFARLRTQDGRHLFTLKRPTDNELACLEFETAVADRDQMHQAILHMGFYPPVRIVKTRRTARARRAGAMPGRGRTPGRVPRDRAGHPARPLGRGRPSRAGRLRPLTRR